MSTTVRPKVLVKLADALLAAACTAADDSGAYRLARSAEHAAALLHVGRLVLLRLPVVDGGAPDGALGALQLDEAALAALVDRAWRLLFRPPTALPPADAAAPLTAIDDAALALLIRELPSLVHYAGDDRASVLLQAILQRAVYAEAATASAAAGFHAHSVLRLAAFYEVPSRAGP